MQLKITTDYAIRTILYLAEKNRQVTSVELAEKLSMPQKYLPKILGVLKREEIVRAQSGVNGGYTLNKRAEDISIFQIITIMETTVKLNRCLESDHFCSRCGVGSCVVHHFFDEMQAEIETKMKNMTIAALLQRGGKNGKELSLGE